MKVPTPDPLTIIQIAWAILSSVAQYVWYSWTMLVLVPFQNFMGLGFYQTDLLLKDTSKKNSKTPLIH